MSLQNVEDLFHHELRDVLDAERQIIKALPKMAKAAESEELRAAFEEHLEVTEEQVARLEKIFKRFDKAPRAKHCPGMEGIISEGSELIEEEESGSALDAALIGAAQKVEHYEIASYGTLISYAKHLEMDEIVDLLEESLAEEKEADEKLTFVAEQLKMTVEKQRAA